MKLCKLVSMQHMPFFSFILMRFDVKNFEKKGEYRMLIFLHQKYEIKLRNLFRIFEKTEIANALILIKPQFFPKYDLVTPYLRLY